MITSKIHARLSRRKRSRTAAAAWAVGLAGTFLVLTIAISGCLAVGYSSTGGWFVWPGGLGLLVLILLVLFFLRRRR